MEKKCLSFNIKNVYVIISSSLHVEFLSRVYVRDVVSYVP